MRIHRTMRGMVRLYSVWCATGALFFVGACASQAETLTRACNSGKMRSCVGLGQLYEHGRDVPKDEVRAATLYRQACNGGVMDGCSRLGDACLHGRGIPKDEAQAASLFQQGCDSGNGDHFACKELGKMYLTGVGVPADKERAAQAFELGCRLPSGFADGRGMVGSFDPKTNQLIGVMYIRGGIGLFRDGQLIEVVGKEVYVAACVEKHMSGTDCLGFNCINGDDGRGMP